MQPHHATAKNIFLVLILFAVLFSLPSTAVSAEKENEYSQSYVARMIDQPFYQAVDKSRTLRTGVKQQSRGMRQLPGAMAHVWRTVQGDNHPFYPLLLIFQIVAIISTGVLLELAVRRKVKPVLNRIGAIPLTPSFLFRVQCILSAIVIELLFVVAYCLPTFLLYITLFPAKGIPAMVTANYLLAGYYIRALLFLTRVFLAPASSQLRILPFTDQVARFLFGWTLMICGMQIIIARSGIVMKKLGPDDLSFLALVGLIILSTVTMLLTMILQRRQQVAAALCDPEKEEHPLVCHLAPFWYLPAIGLVLVITCLWELQVLDSNKIHFGKIIIVLLSIPLYFSMDIWGQRLLEAALTRSAGKKEEEEFSLADRVMQGGYRRQILFVYRGLLLAMLLFMFLGLFRIDVTLGRMFTGGALSIGLSLALLYIVWQIFTAWIDRKIRAEIPEDEEADEGGKGGSRRGTLLLLLRKFTLAMLVILTFLFILSAIGVNIAPLIAGAGIIGLAISFGAQSLVTDIFAGIFFLIDDAFRVGDYVDTGTAKGLVEQISLRAVRLRHHRGMIQTVPFGKIGTVVNFSRDYIIMKLDIRVRYDTDVEKVRKIVKRIYKELLADPDFGPKLIGKLKSQGVRQMDDSAMIMRIKFTTPPGEQFEVRKEVYRRIQEAFRENNVEFAHRNVTVYMPGETDAEQEGKRGKPTADNLQTLAAAAALQEEENRAEPRQGDR